MAWLAEQLFFSMDSVEGRTLAASVREQPLAARRPAACLKAVAEAVHCLHGLPAFAEVPA
jgi:aminoglycoside phosphotransferase (APT) family kinase protein